MSGMQQRFESRSRCRDLKMAEDEGQVPETGVVAARGSQARQALAAECDSCGRWLTGIPRTERRRTDMRQHGVALCTHSPGAGTERPSLNRKRDAADKTAGANQGGTAMLAEIFMLRLEAAARAAKEAANSSRFVPITLPSAKAS